MVGPTKEALEVAYSSSILSGRQFIGVRAAAKIKAYVLVSHFDASSARCARRPYALARAVPNTNSARGTTLTLALA